MTLGGGEEPEDDLDLDTNLREFEKKTIRRLK
jgi:hypothetical protein